MLFLQPFNKGYKLSNPQSLLRLSQNVLNHLYYQDVTKEELLNQSFMEYFMPHYPRQLCKIKKIFLIMNEHGHNQLNMKNFQQSKFLCPKNNNHLQTMHQNPPRHIMFYKLLQGQSYECRAKHIFHQDLKDFCL